MKSLLTTLVETTAFPVKLRATGLYRQLTAWCMPFLLLFSALSSPAQDENAEGGFSSVQERRLHVRIIEEHDNLANEKKALLLKEKKLQSLEADIDRKLNEIDDKLEEMALQKAQLEELLNRRDEARQRRLEHLGAVYENMNPIQAARALSNLDPPTAAAILSLMRPRSAARVINAFRPEKASEISRLMLAEPHEAASPR